MSEVSAQLDLQIQNGSLHVLQYNADALTGAAYAEGLSDLFYDCPPVKEFRRRYNLTRIGGKKPFLQALLKAYKMFAGRPRAKKPNIAHSRIPQMPTGRSEYEIFREYFRAEGYRDRTRLARTTGIPQRRAAQPAASISI